MKNIVTLFFVVCFLNLDAKASTQQEETPWLMNAFLSMSQTQPDRLLKLADNLFSEDAIRISSVDSAQAFDWQHRLAMVSALSEFFEPNFKSATAVRKQKVRTLLKKALHKDPALIVRDGTVESLRRIFQMQPAEAATWKTDLEKSFLDSKNSANGEGYFIRETLLYALREGSLPLSKKIKATTLKDKNKRIKELVSLWDNSVGSNFKVK